MSKKYPELDDDFTYTTGWVKVRSKDQSIKKAVWYKSPAGTPEWVPVCPLCKGGPEGWRPGRVEVEGMDQLICRRCASGIPDPIKNKPRVGRNDFCPCGSSKKYKKCCYA